VRKIDKVVSGASFVAICVCALLLFNSTTAEARRGQSVPDYCKEYTGSPQRACMYETPTQLLIAPGYACDGSSSCITCKAAAFETCTPHQEEGWEVDD